MIGLPTGTSIWIAAGFTDLRRGFTGLSGMVQTTLQENPFSGHVFVFRGRRGDLIKMLWWDGDGLCLFARSGSSVDASSGRKRQAEQCRLHEPSYRCLLEEDRLAATGTHANAAVGGVGRISNN